MRAENRRKLLPYLAMNFIVAIAFQNCQSQSSGSPNTSNSSTIEQTNHETSQSDSIPGEDPVTVGTFPGEHKEIQLFSDKGKNSEIPIITLSILNLDQKLFEAHLRLSRLERSEKISSLTCTHSFNDNSEEFDCTQLEDFILEKLEAGNHRFRVALTTDDHKKLESPVIHFEVSK